jgi:glucose-1-phosphate thymidylyltransferase
MSSNYKGIILAGGSGKRLYPITKGVSKQLLPIYDKPMIYYPLSVLMLAGIQEICIITTADSNEQFISLLGDGSQWGVSFTYIIQPSPNGLAEAYILADKFLDNSPSAMVLGDNIFYGSGFSNLLASADKKEEGATVFAYEVADPTLYGVVSFDNNGCANFIAEKPSEPKSNFAITGLYFLDNDAPQRAKTIKPSSRGELEITSLLETYLKDGTLRVEIMSRGYAWLDTGTHSNLLEAGNFVRTLQERQGLQIGCPEEIAYNNQWINTNELIALSESFSSTNYGQYLLRLAES